MPAYNFLCTKCGTAFRKLYSVEQFNAEKNSTSCTRKGCGYVAGHLGGSPSSQTMEVLDSGLMPRRLERLAEAERIFKEREIAHKQKYSHPEDQEE
jgi:hypothetical protein